LWVVVETNHGLFILCCCWSGDQQRHGNSSSSLRGIELRCRWRDYRGGKNEMGVTLDILLFTTFGKFSNFPKV
ncbi:hypothetical protein, partial [Parvimonas sp. D9]|uniref:hypothetical protein n=1 Tax=Parvimonas sp. D9 TaxID=3110689 RepID=UPI002B470634